MEITFEVTLQYDDDTPEDDESTPTADDIAKWIMRGMGDEGFSSADVCISGT